MAFKVKFPLHTDKTPSHFSYRSWYGQGCLFPDRFSSRLPISLRRKTYFRLGGGGNKPRRTFHLDLAEQRYVRRPATLLYLTIIPEPRIAYGIPIIGCPDFLQLMTPRAQQYSISLSPPHLPESLLSYIRQHDPVSTPFQAQDASNPFMGKKILVLSGDIDTLVPWTASQKFVENLWVGNKGAKKVIVFPDVGHECTTTMIAEAAQFIKVEALQIHYHRANF